jgi:vacuolar-type H+-ATPase subunit H
MDEKVLEEIRFHQDVVTKDANSPLYQIREKEMEISGRVLAARNQAEKIVSDARKKAAEQLKKAETGAEQAAKKRVESVMKDADKTAATVVTQSEKDVIELAKTLEARRDAAVEYVVKLVTTV